jgi:hypothetical protein
LKLRHLGGAEAPLIPWQDYVLTRQLLLVHPEQQLELVRQIQIYLQPVQLAVHQ